MDESLKELYHKLCKPPGPLYGPRCPENEKVCKKPYTAEMDNTTPELNKIGYAFVNIHSVGRYTRKIILYPEYVWTY